MIERRSFEELPREEQRGLKTWRHLSTERKDPAADFSACFRTWNDHEISPNTGLALQLHANIEIIVYVREGSIDHTDSLGNEGHLQAGSVQVTSAGTGIRHEQYNCERTPARIFQISFAASSAGGSPGWAMHPAPVADHRGIVVIASGADSDTDALPIRACARVLHARLAVGESVAYSLLAPRCAYLVPSTGSVDVNGVRIYGRDGAAIKDVDIVTITAIEDTDLLMVDFLGQRFVRPQEMACKP